MRLYLGIRVCRSVARRHSPTRGTRAAAALTFILLKLAPILTPHGILVAERRPAITEAWLR